MADPPTLSLTPRGPFSLRASSQFGFGPTEGNVPEWDGAWRMAFVSDDGSAHAGVVLSQPEENGPVQVELHGDGDPAAVGAQLERMLGLDHDGEEFLALGRRDPVLGALQRALPGQRPVLFASPYEAAAWSVLSARWQMARGARVRAELGRDLGQSFTLAGQKVPAFPTPAQLVAIAEEHPDLSARKLDRLRGVAAAALEGDLDVKVLKDLGPEGALESLQRLDGIGPFYASLIVLRAVGFADAWLGPEPGRVEDAFIRAYGADADPEAVAEGWRPFRTWATVLTRIAAHRDLTPPAGSD